MNNILEKLNLIKPLIKAINKIKDQYLLTLIAVGILIVIAAAFTADLQITVTVAITYVILFMSYLLYQLRVNLHSNRQLGKDVGNKLALALREEDYLGGIETQRDFAGVIVGKLRQIKENSGGIEQISQVLIDDFKIPIDYFN